MKTKNQKNLTMLAGTLLLLTAANAEASYTITDLGTLGGTYSGATAINNNGQVVGFATTATGSADRRAFLYSGGNLLDLNNLLPSGSSWNLTDARDINDLGQIVGMGKINGQVHAYLMTPTTVPSTSHGVAVRLRAAGADRRGAAQGRT